MASVTLAESAKLSLDLLVQGVIENVITVNPIFQVLPFDQIEGNSLKYNRENALGDAEFITVGDTIVAKAAATFTSVTSSLTVLIGDAEVDHFIQTTRSNMTDQKAVQVASKAKSIGRKYQDTMVNGDDSVVTDSFDGMLILTAASMKHATATNGENLSFAILDALMDLVVAKDGQVDFFMMPARTIRAYLALLRALGGAAINETVALPGGTQQISYRSVPIFRNDWIPVNQVQGSSGSVCTTVFAGCFDDGSRKVGLSGLTTTNNSGVFVTEVGESETKNETITRVRFYSGLALFSEKALASASGILN
jgi:hypothetical protein